jgi:ElaB/YqjD/DUF883 family membrane-anchored ribosome-binding protein
MNKYQQWWDSLSPQMREYLKNQPIWYDRDLYKAMAVGAVMGFLLGVMLGYAWAWQPALKTLSWVTG